jgi:pimeloyl-ACP methyl ester carboxylesterase
MTYDAAVRDHARAPVGAIGLLACSLASVGCEQPAPRSTRAVVLESCHLDGLSKQALCGVVEVREDPQDPSSRTIPLRVAVIEASERKPEADSVWFLAGGPGQAATEAFPPMLGAFEDIGRDRDIVLVDIRGTGSSTPLDCQTSDALADLIRAQLDLDELGECLAQLPGDPVHHTTRNVVEDLDAVRAALGYEQINLIGGSYGTRLALEYARHHGERVRTLVLDGVAPPQMALPEGFAVDAQAAFDALVADCKADPACAKAFPDVAGDLDRALARIGDGELTVAVEHPRTGVLEQLTVDRAVVVNGLRGILYVPYLSALLPLLIHRAAEGEFGPLLVQAAVFSDAMAKSVSSGLMLSILCAEDLPRIEPEAQRARDRATFLGPTSYELLAQACAHWPHAPLPETAGEPVRSDVPTLLLSGAVDPVTPPRWAELAGETLANSIHVIVPNTGHGTMGIDCVTDQITAFIASADPSTVDGSRVEGIERPFFFIDFAGPNH